MTSKFALICLLGVALINFAPVIGVISPAKMSAAYGIDLSDPNLRLLMQHRAVLFGIVGGFMLFSLISPSYQSVAIVMAGVSMVSFLVLFELTGADRSVFDSIIKLDILGLVLLFIAVALQLVETQTN